VPAGRRQLAQAGARPDARHYTREEIERNRPARRETYAAIRRAAVAGLSERAIECKHHVGRRTIIKALASAEPPARTYVTSRRATREARVKRD